MKKMLLVVSMLLLAIIPVFAFTDIVYVTPVPDMSGTKFSLGLGGGYPNSGVYFNFDFTPKLAVDVMLGIDCGSPKIGFGSEVYMLYVLKLSDIVDFRPGAGMTFRLGEADYNYFAFAGQLGFQFNIPRSRFAPFIKANLGYATLLNKFFWEGTAGFVVKI